MNLKDEDIIKHAAEHATEFYTASNIRDWHTYELRENYDMVAGDASGLGQWAADDYAYHTLMEMPIVTANFISPAHDQIAGFAEQNPISVDFIPRLSEEEARGFTDMMDKTARWMETTGGDRDCQAKMFRDLLTCGIASSDSNIIYNGDDRDGTVKIDRLYPGYVGWDVTACETNLLDADCVWRVKLVRRKVIEKMMKAKGFDGYSVGSGLTGGRIRDLLKISTTDLADVEEVFQYQWRELEPFYRVKNPFTPFAKTPEQMTPIDQFIMEIAEKAEKELEFDLSQSALNLNPQDYGKLKKLTDSLGLDLEKAKLETYRYYRAVIVGNVVVEKSENASQSCFTQQFMTGKYSENERMFFGMTRGQKEPQRMFNRSLSLVEASIKKAAIGGDDIEAGAVMDGDVQGFVDMKAKAAKSGTVIYADGAIAGNKTRPRQQVQPPPLLGTALELSRDAVQSVPGISPAMMGVAESADESGLLYSRKVKQGVATLSWALVCARRSYKITQAKLFVDFARIMAKNKPGRFIKIAGDAGNKYERLFTDNIADIYDYSVDTAPSTSDEKYEFSKLLLTLAPQIPQLATLALDGLPYDKKSIDEVKQALLPPPALPPDPTNQALIQAEAENKIAQATANTAKAKLTEAQTLTELEKLTAPPQDIETPDVTETIGAAHDRRMKEREMALQEREMQLKEHDMALRDADMAMRIMTPQPTEQRV